MSLENRIYGWIERYENNGLKGWLSQSEGISLSPKYVDVWISGSKFATLSVDVKNTGRSDLKSMPGAQEFYIKLDKAVFLKELSSANLMFVIRAGEASGPLRVTPKLVLDTASEVNKEAVGLAFGRESSDNVAIVGAGGNLFLLSGSNFLDKLYSDHAMVDVGKWVDIFKGRKSHSVEHGYQYIQILLPEKSSILHWKVPYPAERGSPGYKLLIQAMQDDRSLDGCLLNGLEVLPDEVNSESVFKSFDTHMSTFGARLVLDNLLADFFDVTTPVYKTVGIAHSEMPGDLGARYAVDGNIVDRPPIYLGIENVAGRFCEPKLVKSIDPAEGNRGTYRQWVCPNAPIKKKVVCFGGSSFERGADSTNLSWWGGRIFEEFHFIWNSTADMGLIEELKPDVVICQTIERFLVVTPKA